MGILWRILKSAGRYPFHLGLVYITAFIGTMLSLVIPWSLGSAIDVMVKQDPVTRELVSGMFTMMELVPLCAGILIASSGGGLLGFVRGYIMLLLNQKIASDYRNLTYDRLQNANFAFYDHENTGDLIHRATSDINTVIGFISTGTVQVLQTFIRITVIPIILFATNWELVLLCAISTPAVLVRLLIIMGPLKKRWRIIQETEGKLSVTVQENLTNRSIIKAFASEDYERKKYNRVAKESMTRRLDVIVVQKSNNSWLTLHFMITMGMVLWAGGLYIIKGDMSVGQLLMFILYIGQLNGPVRSLIQFTSVIPRTIPSGQRLFGMLDRASPIPEHSDAIDAEHIQGHVKFHDVNFSYRNKASALRDINIDVKPGQTVAILGHSGSGKTTVANLLPRFYDVASGKITIDGIDTKRFTVQSLRHNIGIIHQDSYLFSATIHDNIAYGVTDATQEDVERAAKIAQLHDHIVSLPNGYNTWIGERGITLSGGQRQRLSIARTILVNPPILIMDDSMSSVDVETERQIHRAMSEAMKDRTTFVIAHRLSTVQEADQIIVLDRGAIVEQGTHEELVNADGIYQSIYELQLQPQETT